MIVRLSPLALVMVAACSTDAPTPRLVGKWKHDLQLTKGLRAELVANGEDPEAALAKVGAEIAWAQPDGGEWFRADGTWSLSSYVLTYEYDTPTVHDTTDNATWRIVSGTGDRVCIVILGDELSPDWQRTLVFEGPDVIREEGGDFDGMRYRRVPDVK